MRTHDHPCTTCVCMNTHTLSLTHTQIQTYFSPHMYPPPTHTLRGLLIRGGDILEATSHIDTVVFDKTGTLTIGKPTLQQIQHIQPTNTLQPTNTGTMNNNTTSTTTSPQNTKSHGQHHGLHDRELLALAAAVERNSTHPVGKAIVAAADAAGAPCLAVEQGSLHQEAGCGVVGRVGGVEVALGTWEWAQQCAVGLGDGRPVLKQLAVANSSVVYVVVDKRLVALMEVSDEVRGDAAVTIAELKARGVSSVILSGMVGMFSVFLFFVCAGMCLCLVMLTGVDWCFYSDTHTLTGVYSHTYTHFKHTNTRTHR